MIAAHEVPCLYNEIRAKMVLKIGTKWCKRSHVAVKDRFITDTLDHQLMMNGRSMFVKNRPALDSL